MGQIVSADTGLGMNTVDIVSGNGVGGMLPPDGPLITTPPLNDTVDSRLDSGIICSSIE